MTHLKISTLHFCIGSKSFYNISFVILPSTPSPDGQKCGRNVYEECYMYNTIQMFIRISWFHHHIESPVRFSRKVPVKRTESAGSVLSGSVATVRFDLLNRDMGLD